MMKFNKTLLALAVAGAMMLPAASMAATLSYNTAGTQITFAKDLIVNDGTTIYTPNSLQFSAQTSDILNQFDSIAAGDKVKVKVTLTNGAKFDTTADAPTLVAGFTVGDQLAGAGAPVNLTGTIAPYYSTGGQELNFEFVSPGAGVIGAVGDYAVQLNSMQITNLVQGLVNGDKVGAEITMQNASGQQVLASKATIAKSKWGVVVSDVAGPDANVTIDVGSVPRKTVFSSTGVVGAADRVNFNAGGFALDIAQDAVVGGGTGYVNNYNAVALNPEYNVVSTADIAVVVTGSDLAAFNGQRVWLDANANCSGFAAANAGTISTDGTTATFASPANAPMWANVTNASPGPATAYVCFGSNNVAEMQPQDLSGTVTVAYNLSTQRVDPPVMDFSLLPLRLNGTTMYFQNVNPGSNPTAQSFMRLTNHNVGVCPITIDAKDDAGLHSGEVKLTLAPHASMQLNSDMLEGSTTKPGVTGALGDGTGKWYVRVTAECDNFTGSALNRNGQTGTVTDLTPEKNAGLQWRTPSNSL